jgi:hypothetical protein
MAETTQYMFAHHELVEALIKKQGLHEGLWQMAVEFHLGATIAGPDAEQLKPTAMVGVHRIGIQRTDKKSNLAVDAATINPAPAKAVKRLKKPT